MSKKQLVGFSIVLLLVVVVGAIVLVVFKMDKPENVIWSKIISEEGKFKVEMPNQVTENSALSVKTASGKDVKTSTYSSVVGRNSRLGVKLFIVSFDPLEVDFGGDQKLVRENFSKLIDEKVLTEGINSVKAKREISHRGHFGIELKYDGQDSKQQHYTATQRTYMIRDMLYTLQIAYFPRLKIAPDENTPEDERFFNSFELLEK